VRSLCDRENLPQPRAENQHDVEVVHVSDCLRSNNEGAVIVAKEKAPNLPTTRGESKASSSSKASTSTGQDSSTPVEVEPAIPSR